MDPDDECAYRVELFVYDLTRGLAKTLSPALLGKEIDGVWHTGVVAYGREYFFGSGGIESCKPGGTILGEPDRIEDLGESQVPYQLFLEYIFGLGESAYRPGAYDLLKHNCNNFSDEISQFLCGRGIPKSILQLPEEILNTPAGLTLNETLKKLDLKHANSRSINFGPLSSSALGPAINVVRRSSYHDPEFDALNDAIDQVRHNSVLLEERRNSLNDKLSKKERKERRREKRERKEQRRRARSEAGDDRVLRKKKKNKPPLPPSSGESSSLSTSVSLYSRDALNHVDSQADDLDRAQEAGASSRASEFEPVVPQPEEETQLPDEGFTETVTAAAASVDGLSISEPSGVAAEETPVDWEPVDDFWGSQAPDSPIAVRRFSSYLVPSSEPEASPSPPQIPNSPPSSPTQVHFTAMEDAPAPESAERAAAAAPPPPLAESDEPEVEREPPILFKEDVDVSIEGRTNPLRCSVSSSLTPHPSPSPPSSPDSCSPIPPRSPSSLSASPRSSPLSWSRGFRSRSSSPSDLEFGEPEIKSPSIYDFPDDEETVCESNSTTGFQGDEKSKHLSDANDKNNASEKEQRQNSAKKIDPEQQQEALKSVVKNRQNEVHLASPMQIDPLKKEALDSVKAERREAEKPKEDNRSTNQALRGANKISRDAKSQKEPLQPVKHGSPTTKEVMSSPKVQSIVHSKENISPLASKNQEGSLLNKSSTATQKSPKQQSQNEAKLKFHNEMQLPTKPSSALAESKMTIKAHPKENVEIKHLPLGKDVPECRKNLGEARPSSVQKNNSGGVKSATGDSRQDKSSKIVSHTSGSIDHPKDSKRPKEILPQAKNEKLSKNSNAEKENIPLTHQSPECSPSVTQKCPKMSHEIESGNNSNNSNSFKDSRSLPRKKSACDSSTISDEISRSHQNKAQNTKDVSKAPQNKGPSLASPKTVIKPSVLPVVSGHSSGKGKNGVSNLQDSEIQSYSSPSTPLAPPPDMAPLRRNLTEDIAKFLKRTAPAEVAKRFSCPINPDSELSEPVVSEADRKVIEDKPIATSKKSERQPVKTSDVTPPKVVPKNADKQDKKLTAKGEDVSKSETKEPRQPQEVNSNSKPSKDINEKEGLNSKKQSPSINFDDLGGEAPKSPGPPLPANRGIENSLLFRAQANDPRPPPPPYRPRTVRPTAPRTSLVRGAGGNVAHPQPQLPRPPCGSGGPRFAPPNMGASSLRGFRPVMIASNGPSAGLPPPCYPQSVVLVRPPLVDGVVPQRPGCLASPALVPVPVGASPVAGPPPGLGQWVVVPTQPQMLIGPGIHNEVPPGAKITNVPDGKPGVSPGAGNATAGNQKFQEKNSSSSTGRATSANPRQSQENSANSGKTNTNPKQSQEKSSSSAGKATAADPKSSPEKNSAHLDAIPSDPSDGAQPADSNVIETKFHIYPPDYYAQHSGESCDSDRSSYETSRDSSSSSLCRSSTSSSSMSFGSSYYMLYVVDPIERPATPHESLSSPETSPTPDDAAQRAVSSNSGLVKNDSNSSVISFRTITPEPEYFDANDKAFRELRGLSRVSSDEALCLEGSTSPSRGSISTLKMSPTESSVESAKSSRSSPVRKKKGQNRHRSQPASPARFSSRISRACSLESLSSFLRRMPRAPSTLASLSSLDLPALSPSRSPPPVGVDRPPSTDSIIIFPSDDDENEEPSVLYRPVPRYSGSSSPPSLPSQLCLLGPSRPREDPLTFPAVARQARRDFDELVGSCMHQLTPEEQQHMEELRAYVVEDDGAWALGENFGDLFTRIFHDPNIPEAARLHLTRILAVAALKDDVILLLHQDRKDHTIMNFANKVEHLSPQLQEAIALFFCNMFEHLSPSEWLLYISEWTLEGSQPISNIRVTTKVAVNALLHSSERVQNYGSALMYNLGTKEVKTVVFDDVAPELAMAILQYFNTKPKEELLWRTMTALCRFCYASNEVPSLIKMIGPEPSTFKGTSERVDSVIEEIMVKLSRVRLF